MLIFVCRLGDVLYLGIWYDGMLMDNIFVKDLAGPLNTLIETSLYGFDDLVSKFRGSYCTDMKNQLKLGVQISNNTDLLRCTDLQ